MRVCCSCQLPITLDRWMSYPVRNPESREVSYYHQHTENGCVYEKELLEEKEKEKENALSTTKRFT